MKRRKLNIIIASICLLFFMMPLTSKAQKKGPMNIPYSDITRMDVIDEKAFARVEKYAAAIALLTETK